MGFKIEERFEVNAPVERVWRYLIDPRQVVECLPGAELTGQETETTFLGRVTVKVGPVTASYTGKAQLGAIDERSHTAHFTGEGKEKGGAGSARMRMLSRVTALPNGASEVFVDAEVDIAGKIVQFGRGMIEAVSKQLFKQFADCMRITLSHPPADIGIAPLPPPPVPAARPAELEAMLARTPSLNDTFVGIPAARRPSTPSDRPVQLADRSALAADLPAWTGGVPRRPEAGNAVGRPVRTSTPAPRVKPVNVIPLVLRALWELMRGMYLRFTGRRR